MTRFLHSWAHAWATARIIFSPRADKCRGRERDTRALAPFRSAIARDACTQQQSAPRGDKPSSPVFTRETARAWVCTLVDAVSWRVGRGFRGAIGSQGTHSELLDVGLEAGVLEGAADEALGVVDSVLGVARRLLLGRGTNEALTVV